MVADACFVKSLEITKKLKGTNGLDEFLQQRLDKSMICKKIGVSKEEKEYRILIRPGPAANADALSPDAELYQDQDGRRHVDQDGCRHMDQDGCRHEVIKKGTSWL